MFVGRFHTLCKSWHSTQSTHFPFSSSCSCCCCSLTLLALTLPSLSTNFRVALRCAVMFLKPVLIWKKKNARKSWKMRERGRAYKTLAFTFLACAACFLNVGQKQRSKHKVKKERKNYLFQNPHTQQRQQQQQHTGRANIHSCPHSLCCCCCSPSDNNNNNVVVFLTRLGFLLCLSGCF